MEIKMWNYDFFKTVVSICTGAVTAITGIIAKVDSWAIAFISLMIIDYLVSGIVLAVLKKSPNTEYGGLSSKAGFKGIVKKVVMVLCVGVSYIVDMLLGTSMFCYATVIALSVNEIISILESAALIDIKIPVLQKALDRLEVVLENQEENNE